MADIFLSYAREDKLTVSRLAARLEAAGLTVWWDHNLAGGARYLETTETELKASRAVVVCWSQVSIKSHWVADEATIGRDEQRLVPISLDGSQPPLGFRQFQVIDFTRWGHGDTKALPKLLDALAPLVKSAPPAAPLTPTPRRGVLAAIRLRRRLIVAGLGLVAILGLGVSAALWARGNAVKAKGAASAPSVAVLPFEDLGGTPKTSGLTRTGPRVVADVLAEYGEKVVPTARSLAVTAANRATASHDLDAEFLVEGDVRAGAGDAAVLTVRLSDAKGRSIWVRRFEGQGAEADDLPEQAGAVLASALRSKGDFKRPGFISADDDQLRQNDHHLEAYVQVRRNLETDTDNPRLLANEAAYAGLALADLPIGQRRQIVADLRKQIGRLPPPQPFAQFMLTPEIEWSARDAIANQVATTRGLTGGGMASLFLAHAGRETEALALSEQTTTAVPLSPARLSTAGAAYLTSGRYQQAVQAMDKAARRWPEQPTISRVRFMARLALGRTKEASDLLANPRLRGHIDPPGRIQPAALIVRAVETHRPADIAAMSAACTAKDRLADAVIDECLFALNLVGRVDDAFALSDQVFPDLRAATAKGREDKWLRNPTVIFKHSRMLFAVATGPMREDRRFIALVERIGLADYWRATGRWPDFCTAEPRSVCADLRAK